MRKLNLDELTVDSFVTMTLQEGSGTVLAKEYTFTDGCLTCYATCNNGTCDETCGSCNHTCGYSCGCVGTYDGPDCGPTARYTLCYDVQCH
jgi:hypothetical protein